ncbi:Splicing factor U2AF 26 kDa subunit [Dimargaris verticillata]|uniref:Splicing factor U2AF 26 kDa subunit n=1 Tax=Dimargaris verticillata TaxID=2761393 RepID=A0A9W8EFS7_9FUNG|nr:Splicing factor U2AF 26 kDa subunit [Dimargaris verticillata]
MADHLASIYGTEKDKVNCSFYFKIGACRHGDRCSRKHVKPTFSPTVLMPNLYRNPARASESTRVSRHEVQDDFDAFYEDLFTEIALKYGEIEEMNVCDNDSDHLAGNVYVLFHKESDAERAVEHLNQRYYRGQPIHAELSPVSDFREAYCRLYEMGECTHGGFCNFMHFIHPSSSLRRSLFDSQDAYRRRLRRERRAHREKDYSRQRRDRSPHSDVDSRDAGTPRSDA